ncbi:MAG TPA: hypothetical protein VHD83_04000 [Puia sp.]|nr:hypothetical protein [Puia sp.]
MNRLCLAFGRNACGVSCWLESKVANVPVQDVIREKYLEGGRRLS